MVVAYLFLGGLAGGIGFFAALLLGFSLWASVLAYGALGAATVLILSFVRYLSVSARQSGAQDGHLDAPVISAHLATARNAVLATATPGAGHAMRILAVDDDPLILDLIPRIAAQVGCHDITTVSSGALALLAIETAEQPFDCLLLDIDMPGIDGIEVCARVRCMEAYEGAAIVMLTALSDLSFLQRAFRAGATDYTTKPFDVIEFAERLRSAQAWTNVRRSSAGRAQADTVRRARFGASRLLPGMVKVPLLVNTQAFQNYLARLPGSALPGTYVMAVVVDRLAKFKDDLPSIKHLSQLASVAAAIDDVFARNEYVLVYDERGHFILASNDARTPSSVQIESALQSRLDQQGLHPEHERTTVYVGSAVRPGGKSVQRAKIAMDAAIHLAQQRAAQHMPEPQPVVLFKTAQS